MANAKKFNNGEDMGTVRQILNDNADAINQRVEKEEGKDLITTAERTKLNSIAANATANSSDEALRARSTHTGTQSADTITDGTINKAYTATEKTKLSGIATGATANSTDANLKSRTNHTGTQAISTITDLQTNLDNRPPTTPGSPIKPTGTWYGTQAQYDALPTKTATYKYEIYEA